MNILNIITLLVHTFLNFYVISYIFQIYPPITRLNFTNEKNIFIFFLVCLILFSIINFVFMTLNLFYTLNFSDIKFYICWVNLIISYAFIVFFIAIVFFNALPT
jgi:hypothetical protein